VGSFDLSVSSASVVNSFQEERWVYGICRALLAERVGSVRTMQSNRHHVRRKSKAAVTLGEKCEHLLIHLHVLH
jgi:hypothetical protein